jgi:tRNA A37 methylthiotransferase MiaB
VSKFFARPKTAAWEIRKGLVDKEETKRRSAKAAEVAKEISAAQNRKWVGWSGQVLVDEKGKVEGSWIGRNFAYKPVVVKCGDELLGKIVSVEVVEASQTYLKGKIVDQQADGELGYMVI